MSFRQWRSVQPIIGATEKRLSNQLYPLFFFTESFQSNVWSDLTISFVVNRLGNRRSLLNAIGTTLLYRLGYVVPLPRQWVAFSVSGNFSGRR
jgi:hypothetical protein